MSYEEFHHALKGAGSEVTEQMFRFGYACGKNNSINFSQVREAFTEMSINEQDEKLFMHRIVDGFRSGSDFDTTVFFG